MDLNFFENRNKFSKLIVYLIVLLLAIISTILLLNSEYYNLLPLKLIKISDPEYLDAGQIYYDVDGNDSSEIFLFKKTLGRDVIEFHDDNGDFIDVLRPAGAFSGYGPSYIFVDSDEDKASELFIFVARNDSIFLNGYELKGDEFHFVKDRFIDLFPENEGLENLIFSGIDFLDLENDHSSEIVFIVRGGYSLQPRKIYSYNPRTDLLKKTPPSAAAYINFSMVNKNRETHENIIICGCNALENFQKEDKILFNDNSGWIIAYDSSLSKTVFVREYPENKTFIHSAVAETEDGPKIFALVTEYKTGSSYLERLNLSGELEKSVQISSIRKSQLLLNSLFPAVNNIMIASPDSIIIFNQDLVVLRHEAKAGLIKTWDWTSRDSFSAKTGFIIFTKGDILTLRDSTARIVGKLKIPGLEENNMYAPGVKQFLSANEFIVGLSANNRTFHFKIQENKLFKFRYGISLLIFFGFYILFYLLFRLQNYFYNRRYNLQSRIAALQLQSVQNQLQPHFTFNVLNTIGSMIYKNEKDQAFEYLNYFSDMLRTTLLSNNQANWQIGEELSFIGAYMDMENLRFDNRFKFVLKIEADTDLTKLVPKLTIQAFVENAVRHGLMHRKGECILSVFIQETKDHIKVEVKDNGIGRAAAGKLSRHHNGLGNEILRNYIDIYNKTNKTKFELTIEDLISAEGVAAGTRILLLVPNNLGSINI